jgi:preprotein translocase subunit SecG
MMLETIVIVVHLLVALAVVGLVLVQQGKGADAGASFGAGGSATVFGGQGSATFLSRFTGILAALFFLTSLGLAYFAKEKAEALSGIGLPAPAAIQAPQQSAPNDDVPVLEKPQSPAESGDVPEASKQ